MNETEDIAGTMATPKPHPAIYVRSASNESQLEERLDDVRALARLHGLEAADCIAEYGSGLDSERPGLQRIMKMVERGEISHLICGDWSPLSRNQRDLRQIMAKLAEASVTVVTSHGTYEPGMAWDLAMRL